MARLSDADQGRFSLPRLDSGGPAGAGHRAVPRLGSAFQPVAGNRHSGVDELLLQVSDDRSGALPRARSVHPIDQDEEHAAPPPGRGTDHPPRTGILRLERSGFSVSGQKLRLLPFFCDWSILVLWQDSSVLKRPSIPPI